MTLEETKDMDVSIYYDHDEGTWKWDLNGGYQSCGARNGYTTPNESLDELIEFLKTFGGFTK